jgi:rubrerythrin
MIAGLLIFGLTVLLFVGWIQRLVLQGQLQKVRGDYSKLREDHSAVSAAHATLQQGYQDMRRIAVDAIQLAHKRHFSPEQEVNRDATITDLENSLRTVMRSQSNYIPPSTANCPRCAVSVRADSWPQQCPSCRTLFNSDGTLDALEATSLE